VCATGPGRSNRSLQRKAIPQ